MKNQVQDESTFKCKWENTQLAALNSESKVSDSQRKKKTNYKDSDGRWQARQQQHVC